MEVIIDFTAFKWLVSGTLDYYDDDDDDDVDNAAVANDIKF